MLKRHRTIGSLICGGLLIGFAAWFAGDARASEHPGCTYPNCVQPGCPAPACAECSQQCPNCANHLHTPPCAGGLCVPNTQQFGFYATRWRRWPSTDAAPTRAGTQKVIAPPAYELPQLQADQPAAEPAPAAPAGPAPPSGATSPPGSTAPVPPSSIEITPSLPGMLPGQLPSGFEMNPMPGSEMPSLQPSPGIRPNDIPGPPTPELEPNPGSTNTPDLPPPTAPGMTWTSPSMLHVSTVEPVLQPIPVGPVARPIASFSADQRSPVLRTNALRSETAPPAPNLGNNPLRESAEVSKSAGQNPLRSPFGAPVAGMRDNQLLPAGHWTEAVSSPPADRANPLRTQ